MDKKAPPHEPQLICCAESSRHKGEKGAALHIFALFFHPDLSVTALGGAEKRFLETLKCLSRKRGLQITALESAPTILTGSQTTCKKHTLHVRARGRGWLSTYIAWILWTMKASLKGALLVCQAKPNVLLIPNNTLPNLVSGLVAGSLSHLPTCTIVHHVDLPLSSSDKARNQSLYGSYRSIGYAGLVSLTKTLTFYVTISLLKKTKAIIAVSEFTKRTLANSGLPITSIFVTGNAVDNRFIDGIRPCAGENAYDGVFVGRIAREKGIFDLLDVWRNVIRTRRSAKLLIIGSGMESREVKERIVEAHLQDNVLMLGKRSDKELYGLLKSSRVFIFPSLFEGWGIAVAEALACGLPVVAYDIPALRENFANCKSVVLVPVKDSERMSSAVLSVLGAGRERSRELEYCSMLYSRQFSWEKVAEKDLNVVQLVGGNYK